VGRETSPCTDAGRKSLGESATSSRASAEKDGAMDIRVGLRTLAQGGHIRLCAACVAGKCMGTSGIDTGTRSNARTDVSADIAFLKELPKSSYQLIVRHELEGNGVERTISLVDQDGHTRPVPSGEQIPIVGGEGRKYRLLVGLKAVSTDAGACCQDEKKGSFHARIILAPAPQVSASVFTTAQTIRASSSTAPAVGLLISRGKRGEPVPSCTGTVIGDRTILTAAHCLEFYSTHAELFFVPGDNLNQNLERAIRITEWVRPSDEFEGGYRYRVEKGRSIDDIALLYTEQRIGIEALEPIKTRLPDADLVALGSFIELVTFITVEERETKFAGEDARKITSQVSLAGTESRTATLVSRAGALCAGWSGAPVMASSSRGPVVVGLTVSGQQDCTRAEALRLDAYWPWLASKIR
jgi:hypothetical protein